ncbi:MAG: hypothetical protein Q4G33_15215 [bacterium]|nr:hypothetical protein [bacterium]
MTLDHIPDTLSAAIAYELDKLKNTVSNIMPDSESDAAEEGVIEEATFEDPGMDIDDKDIKALYDMGYDPSDIETAIELSSEYGKTPYELLQIKGKKAYVTAETAEERKIAIAESKGIEVSEETVDSAEITDVDMTTGVETAELSEISENSNDESETVEVSEADKITNDAAGTTVEYDLEAEEKQWEEVEADLIADTNKEISENPWEAVKALGIDEYIDKSTLSEEEAAELNGIEEETASLAANAVPSGTDMTNIYNDYIFPSEVHNQITQGGYSGDDCVYVNDLTGNNVVKETDLSLKGRNGLDLNLTRRYSVTDSNDYDAIVGKTTQSVTSRDCEFYCVSLIN